jgi:hypothetical protein
MDDSELGYNVDLVKDESESDESLLDLVKDELESGD